MGGIHHSGSDSHHQLSVGLRDASFRLEVQEMCIRDSNNRRVLCKPMDMFGYHYGSMNQALLAYANGEITLHQNLYVYRKATMADGTEVSGFIKTTLGLLIFNEIIPQDLGFVDRSTPRCV